MSRGLGAGWCNQMGKGGRRGEGGGGGRRGKERRRGEGEEGKEVVARAG